MEELKKAALDTIEENKELIASVADQIWEYAELSLQEVRSAALYCNTERTRLRRGGGSL